MPMKPTRLPLPALHAAVVLFWAVLLGASWLVCTRLAPAPAAPAAVHLPVTSAAGLVQCAEGLTATAKRRLPLVKPPPVELLSDARSAR